MPPMKKGIPKLSPFAQMLRDKREKLAPNATLREFCAARGFEAPMIDGMERDRRTAPGTYGALYKLASGYGHGPNDRWTLALLDAALGKPSAAPRPVKAPARSADRGSAGVGRSTRQASKSGRAARARSGVARAASSGRRG